MDGDISKKDAAAGKVEERSDAAKSPSSDNAAFGIPFVLNYWKELDLENARTTMDEQGLKVAEHQENSTKNRRKLAEATRDFRKAIPADQPKMFVGLLKAYQEEVDNLTKRAKFGESAFLGLYQKLYEAPDPVPALASAAELAAKVAELTAENRKMKAELEEFRAESSHLKNQQATVRRLEERNRQLEQQMEEKVKEIVTMREQVLAEESQRGLEALKHREEALQEQLRVARDSVQNMQRLHEMGQTQLFEVKAKSEEEREAKQYELNLLTDEVERAQSRLLSLEREKDVLKAQLKETSTTSDDNEAASSDPDIHISVQHGWEAAIKAKEAIISELHAELHNVESSAADERESHMAELRKLHATLQRKEDEIEELRAELDTRPSARQWEDLRKQVKILQAVGYNAVEVDDWDEGAAESEAAASARVRGTGASGEVGRLEALLLEKNRKVEHELTQAKVHLSERAEQVSGLQDLVKSLETQVDEQKSLIQKLEEDIVKGYSKAPGAEGSTRGRSTSGAPGTSLSGLVSGSSSIVTEGAGARGATAGSAQGTGRQGLRASNSVQDLAEGAEEDGNSMLAVVVGQRDRFRQRISDLEEELRVSRDKNNRLSAEVDKLKADNVKLYERMRYIQTYTPNGGAGGEKGAHGRNRKHTGDVESLDVEQKYKKMYEDGLNPFAAFSSKERELRYKELGIRDWIALTSGKFLLSNKHARTFVFFYSIALHILVFLSMYRLTHYSHQSIKYHSTSHFASERQTPAAVLGNTVEAIRKTVAALSPPPALSLSSNISSPVVAGHVDLPAEPVEAEDVVQLE